MDNVIAASLLYIILVILQVTNKRESLERVEQLSCQDLDLKELISKVGVVRARDVSMAYERYYVY